MGEVASEQFGVSVIIADDQVLFAQGLRRIIEISAPDIRVQSIATNGRELIEHVDRNQPDVVLMDVRMPDIDGVEATRIIHARYPRVRVVMLTTFDDDRYVEQAVENGAVGYLLKDIPPERLFEAVRTVGSDSVMLSPSVARRLAAGRPLLDRSASRDYLNNDRDLQLDDLTERERQVVRLILREFDNRSIAATLHLSERTVRNYVSSIYSKMEVQNRFELIRILRASG